jgi:hypothetical protein
MLYKLKKHIFVALFAVIITSCHGFYEPITLNMEVPEGPPEFRAGFRSGCRSGLGSRSYGFANSVIYPADFGNGIYQHDTRFTDGWRMGLFSCVIHASVFTGTPGNFGPLE